MLLDPVAALNSAKEQFRGTEDWLSPLAWRRVTASAGIAGLDLPARVGGGNYSAQRMIDIFALCGSISLDLRDVPGGGHSRLIVDTRTHAHDHILSGVVNTKEYIAIAITEEDAGSDLHGLKTTAKPVSGGYIISGRKLYVARLSEASQVIIFAQVPRHGMDRTLTAFILPITSPGISYETVNAIGLQGISFGGLSIDNVFASTSMRVGGEGQGFTLFIKHFTYWRTMMAAAAIGCARTAIDQAIYWLRSRHAFGGPIGRFTHLQQQLAKHTADLHMAWLLTKSVSERIDTHLPAFADAAMAKAEAVEIALAAVDWSMRIHGAKGHTDQTDLENRLRDLLCLRIADGTTDVLRGQVARATLGDDLYEISLGRDRIQHEAKISLTSRRFW